MSFRSNSHDSKDTPSREIRLRDLADRKEELQLEREVAASKLEKLDYKIIQTQAEYGALYNVTAPILNLPIEILCRMFDSKQPTHRSHYLACLQRMAIHRLVLSIPLVDVPP